MQPCAAAAIAGPFFNVGGGLIHIGPPLGMESLTLANQPLSGPRLELILIPLP